MKIVLAADEMAKLMTAALSDYSNPTARLSGKQVVDVTMENGTFYIDIEEIPEPPEHDDE